MTKMIGCLALGLGVRSSVCGSGINANCHLHFDTRGGMAFKPHGGPSFDVYSGHFASLDVRCSVGGSGFDSNAQI